MCIYKTTINRFLYAYPNNSDANLVKYIIFQFKGQSWYDYYIEEGVGAKYYVAPEMLGDHHTYKVDIFSMGIVFHAIIEGQYKLDDGKKFYGVFVRTSGRQLEPIGFQMYEQSRNLTLPFQGRQRRLIKRMLKYDPHQRPTAAQVDEILRSNYFRCWFQLL